MHEKERISTLVAGSNEARYPKIQELFSDMHSVLGVYVTNKCNMRCRHCSVNSSPDENSRIAIGSLLKPISDFACLPSSKGIQISGGEPMIYIRDVAQIARIGKDFDLAVAVATNGSWASSVKKASKILDKIPGVTQLLLSTDRYHAEFFPSERVVFAALAAVKKGMHATINICCPPTEENSEIMWFERELSAVLDRVDIVCTYVEPVGRGADLPESYWEDIAEKWPSGGCPQLARPVIVEDGTLLACCNTTILDVARGSFLDAGCVVSGHDVDRKLGELRQNRIVSLMHLFGPSFFASRIDTSGSALDGKSYRKSDICGLCRDLISCNRLRSEMEKIADDPRFSRIADLRLARR